MSCKNCEWLIVNCESDECYCDKADEKQIFLKQGQGKPSWCPLKFGETE